MNLRTTLIAGVAPGYELDGETAVECGTTEYKAEWGTGPCVACDSGQTSTACFPVTVKGSTPGSSTTINVRGDSSCCDGEYTVMFHRAGNTFHAGAVF